MKKYLHGIDMTADPHLVAAALLAKNREKYGDLTMMADPPESGSEDPPGDGGDPSSGEPNSSNGDKGYPPDTPVKDMTAEQRAAYDADKREKNRQQREQWRDATRGKTPEQIKADLAELDNLRQANESAVETAVREARADERTKVLAETNDRLSKAMLRTALSARGKSDEQIDQILSTTALSAFVVEGDVADDKVAAYADLIAGPVTGGGNSWTGTGQGRSNPSRPSGLQAGREAYRQQRKPAQTN